MSVKTHTFNGRRYKIDIDKIDGYCEQYVINENSRSLVILADLKTRKGLITAIHEALHASDWRQSEEAVDRVSKEIGSFLWRLGYRTK